MTQTIVGASVSADLAGVRVGLAYPVRIMAVLNVSPESFYVGSVRLDAQRLWDAAQQAVAEGADIIDVGAMTTAPYLAGRVSVDEERKRLEPAINVVAKAVRVPVSADTQRGAVAAAALAAGATILNDVSGLRGDPEMAALAGCAGGVVLTAAPVGAEPTPGAPFDPIRRLLHDSMQRARAAGVDAGRMVLDPGIGFFTHADVSPAEVSCTVLAELHQLADLGRPWLVGVSRKAFIGTLSGRSDPHDRLFGSLAATAIAVFNGASIIRTHDVGPTRDAIRVAEGIRAQRA